MKRNTNFARFLLVGSLNTILDLILYFIFANLLSLYPVFASILSTGLTMCVSFFLNHHFVFRSNKKKSQTAVQFVSVTLFNVWVIQSAVIYLALHMFRNMDFFVHHHWTLNLFAKLCGVGVSFILNFLMYRYIFHNQPAEAGEAVVL